MSTACCGALSTKDDAVSRMPLDDLIAQRDALLATRLRGVRTSQCSTLSSTISACNLPCSAVMRATVMGRRKRRGPALPGLKKSVPFFVSILASGVFYYVQCYGRMKAKSVSGSQLSATKRNSDCTSATLRVSR